MRWILAFLLLFPAVAEAQNFTTFSASKIQNGSGTLLVTGTLWMQGTDANNTPISFQCGGGGQVHRAPFPVGGATVTGGAISSFNVCNPATTSPAGVYYHVWVIDYTVGSPTYGQRVIDDGLVQWSGASFDFDSWAPPASVNPPVGQVVNGSLTVNGTISATDGIGPIGLGNCSTVIDPFTCLASFAGFQSQVNAVIAEAPATGCHIDLRGYTATVQFTQNTEFPAQCDTLLPYRWTLASGVSLIANAGRLHCDEELGCIGQKSNTAFGNSGDYTPYITTPLGVGSTGGQQRPEIDHIEFGTSSPGGLQMILTAAGNASAGSTVYTGVFPGGGSSAYSGFTFGIVGFDMVANDGVYVCTASTATSITLSNANGVADTHAATAYASPFPVTAESSTGTLAWTLTAASAAVSGVTMYVGTIISGGISPGGWQEFPITITGFSNGGNNGTFLCTNWTSTVLTCSNAGGVLETHAGTATLNYAVTYTGTFPPCASNACAGYQYRIFSPATLSSPSGRGLETDGYFTVMNSTPTTLVVYNINGGGPRTLAQSIAVQAGGWAIAGTFSGAHIHDNFINGTDLGVDFDQTGCTCYNYGFDGNTIFSVHGAFFAGHGFNSNGMSGNLLWASDFGNLRWAASGYGLWGINSAGTESKGLDIENSRYSAYFEDSHGWTIIPQDLENDSITPYGYTGGPTVEQVQSTQITLDDSQNMEVTGPWQITDLSTNFINNKYGSGGNRNSYNGKIEGSNISYQIPNASGVWTAKVAGTGATSYDYWVAGCDINGNMTLPVEQIVSSQNASLSYPSAYNELFPPTFASAGVNYGVVGLSYWKGSLTTTSYLQWCGPPDGAFYDDGTDNFFTGPTPPLYNMTGLVQGATFGTSSHCASAASPAVCASAPAGFVVIAAGQTSVVVDTIVVTANSQIQLTEDESLGTALGVTCNTQALTTLGSPRVTARTPGSSFTISIDTAPTANPMCIIYGPITN